MAYDTGIYCHAIQSKVITNKYFLYKDTNDLLPIDSKSGHVPAGYYDDLSAAKTAAMKFDTKQLPLFLKETIVKFYYYSGSSTPGELHINNNHLGDLDTTNKTAVPYLNVTDETSATTINNAKGAKSDVLTIYNAADRLALKKPTSTYTDTEFALLITNINNTFGLNLPTFAEYTNWTYYNYNKQTGAWEKQTT